MDTRPKATPWYDWKEWKMVFRLLYNENPKEQWKGISIVNAWRVRVSSLPIAVDSTAQMLELLFQIENMKPLSQQESESTIWTTHRSSQELRLAASLSIIRMVNGLVDKEQKNEFARSVNSLAQSLNLPKWLVDIRHKSTHNELPSLDSLKVAIQLSLSWLYENYWLYQQQSLDSYISSLYDDCIQLANTLYLASTSDSVSNSQLDSLYKSLLSKMSVHDCVTYFIPILTGNSIDNDFPVSDCLLYPPTEMTDVHPFIRQWISCIRYFTIKYAPFTSILLYQILLFIDTHQNLPIQKLTILHQYLYLLCTNQYVSTILKTYNDSVPTNKNKALQEKKKNDWMNRIAPLSILESLSYPMKSLVSYLYQTPTEFQSLFSSLLSDQTYISEKKVHILQDLSSIKQTIVSTLSLQEPSSTDVDMTGSPSTSNPYLNDHYYTYQHYVETSSNPLTSTTTDWVITHDIDSFPIGTLFDYLFVLFFTNIYLTHI